MSQARPAILDHELKTREQRAQRASRNGGPQLVEPESPRLFRRKSMAEDMEAAAKRPIPKKLLGDLWYEGEIAILFGGPGEGKTALAVQCANDIAGGVSTTRLTLEADPQPVLYFDFELSDIQHLKRYSEQSTDGRFINPFAFNPNLLRVEMNPQARVFDRISDYEAFMAREIEREIAESGAKIIIVDNITALSREQDKVKFALPMMQRLKDMKSIDGRSMLVLAHTPKRDGSRPMTLNDLAGSQILSNLCDSVSSICNSAIDTRLRVIKQHKVRSGEKIYHSDNVAVFRFEKTANHLGFELIGHSHEKKHLQSQTDETREKMIAEARAMNDAGRTHREIANALQVSLGAVNNYLKRSRTSRNGDGRLEIEFLDPERQRAWDSWEERQH